MSIRESRKGAPYEKTRAVGRACIAVFAGANAAEHMDSSWLMPASPASRLPGLNEGFFKSRYCLMRSEYFMMSARLGFRCWGGKDLSLAMALWGNPEVTRLIGGPFSDMTIRARLEQEISQQREHGLQYWPIFLLESNEHVGCAGLRPYRSEPRVRELGFHLRPTFWNQGLATEAARACIDYAFRALGVEALFAGHHPANEASRRLLLKLGFEFARDEFYPPTGLMHPSYLLERK